jgi:integrase/recombinase XerD
MKIHEAAKQFLIHGRTDRVYADETRQKQRDCFASWILPRIGNHEVETVTLRDVLEIRDAILKRGLSESRLSSVLAALKVFFEFCHAALKIECMNPGEIRLPPKKKPNVVFHTPDEIEEIFGFLNLNHFADLRLRAFCELVLGTGMRTGEALRMDRTPFDQDQAEMDIVGKGGKVRTVFFSDRCRFWVKRYLAVRWDSHPALFITTGDPPRRWAREDVSRFFIDLSEKAGVKKKFTPSVLRHTYCTTLRNNGVDISIIKELAGHSDIQTTARYYLGTDEQVLRRAVDEHLHYGEKKAFDKPSVSS